VWRPSESAPAALERGLGRLLVACQAVAALAVLLALVLTGGGAPGAGAIGGVPLALVGIGVLLAGPFLATLGIALVSGGPRRRLRWYALGTLVVAAAGMWLAG
jgi:hypothetical protein